MGRSGEASLSGTTVPSDARLRVAERGAGRAQRGEAGGNLAANITREAVVPVYKPPVHQVPDKKDIVGKYHNPFADSENPFGSQSSGEDLGDNNPFAGEIGVKGGNASVGKIPAPEEAGNPFGEDDYDEELNPFA